MTIDLGLRNKHEPSDMFGEIVLRIFERTKSRSPDSRPSHQRIKS
jgi:hypothetical protein